MKQDHIAYALAAAYKRGWFEGILGMHVEDSERPGPCLAEIAAYADANWSRWVAAANQARRFQREMTQGAG